MREDLDKLLCEKYPKMFVNRDKHMSETCMCWGFCCGDGWFNIIDTLCGHIQHYIDWAEESYNRNVEYNEAVVAAKNGDTSLLAEYFTNSYRLDDRIAEALDSELREVTKPPVQVTVDQVKEKFGTLSFYYTGGDKHISGMVRMAEGMSGVTCEECGAPGTTKGRGWISTLCSEHRTQRDAKYKSDLGLEL
ncbi:hypothetical protein UFOVP116_159 [uncultured Caudovirales phage]|uniref:Uncharacterized protein n=1 Tax=uncultured Caudovirales phage TaxID=2100421 RepID=A0A6J5LE13_9CAUD|nr:hypothetical protein UFOVP116_159 [uncultured Caudovirales phage]